MGNSLPHKEDGASVPRLVKSKSEDDALQPMRERAASFAPGRYTPLPADRIALRDSWQRARAGCPQLPGVFILKDIFAHHDDNKRLFKLFDVPTEELDQCRSFLRHASVFTNVLDTVLRHLQDLETEGAPMLQTLGKRHFYKHAIGFQLDHFDSFSSAMLAFLVAYDSNVTTDVRLRAGWTFVINFIILKLKEGYLLEDRHGSGIKLLFE